MKRLLSTTARCLVLVLCCSISQQAIATDATLPDGTNFASWEKPLHFSKTYYVGGNSAASDDNGPGTSERPFRSISKAAAVLQPGQRVVIASGVYRECVRPARGGTSPEQMISYEAAPGATVVVEGSETLNDGWQPSTGYAFRRGGGAQPPIWKHELKGSLFSDGYNPFAMVTVMADRGWLDTKAVDMGPYFRRRGLIFVNGKPLEPVELFRDLGDAPPASNRGAGLNGRPSRKHPGPVMQEIGGSPDGRFWVEQQGNVVHVRFPDNKSEHPLIEITVREQAFAPLERGLGYLRIKGITFQHAGNAFPPPQRGLVSTCCGHHWIIEDNTIEWAGGVGLDVGNQDWAAARAPQPVGFHIVRGNTIRYCGVEGIGGMRTQGVVVEDNLIEWVGWQDAERAWEAAGAKFHGARNLLFRRNVVRHIRHANALWLDSANVNCRITGNVFADVLTVSAAVHAEMNRSPNQIDNNVIWNVRNAEPGTPGQRGCAGSGIFVHASDSLIIAQNLIGRCDNAGVFSVLREERLGAGTATDLKVYNNIFARCGKAAIVFLSQENEADGNVYVSMPSGYLGFFTGASKQWLDLPAWQESYGWDKKGTVAAMPLDFDADRLELTMSGQAALPKVNVFNHIDSDLFGKVTGQTRAPGPLADPGAKRIREIDPREIRRQEAKSGT